MNHKKKLTPVIMLVLVLLLTACNTPQAIPCPTSAPQSCPTAVAQLGPEMNAWRWEVAGSADIVITFNQGDECSLEQPTRVVTPARLPYEIVVNDQTYKNYVVAFLTLDPGKTLDDLKAWKTSGYNPPWSQLIGIDVVSPLSRTFHSMTGITNSPVYAVCFIQGPDNLRIIDTHGPVEVPVE